MKTIEQQLKEADEACQYSFARHPKAAITTVLWYRLRDLKTRLLKKEMAA
jgi:hypothetical protein